MAVPLIDQDDPSTLERFYFLSPQKEIPWMVHCVVLEPLEGADQLLAYFGRFAGARN